MGDQNRSGWFQFPQCKVSSHGQDDSGSTDQNSSKSTNDLTASSTDSSIELIESMGNAVRELLNRPAEDENFDLTGIVTVLEEIDNLDELKNVVASRLKISGKAQFTKLDIESLAEELKKTEKYTNEFNLLAAQLFIKAKEKYKDEAAAAAYIFSLIKDTLIKSMGNAVRELLNRPAEDENLDLKGIVTVLKGFDNLDNFKNVIASLLNNSGKAQFTKLDIQSLAEELIKTNKYTNEFNLLAAQLFIKAKEDYKDKAAAAAEYIFSLIKFYKLLPNMVQSIRSFLQGRGINIREDTQKIMDTLANIKGQNNFIWGLFKSFVLTLDCDRATLAFNLVKKEAKNDNFKLYAAKHFITTVDKGETDAFKVLKSELFFHLMGKYTHDILNKNRDKNRRKDEHIQLDIGLLLNGLKKDNFFEFFKKYVRDNCQENDESLLNLSSEDLAKKLTNLDQERNRNEDYFDLVAAQFLISAHNEGKKEPLQIFDLLNGLLLDNGNSGFSETKV